MTNKFSVLIDEKVNNKYQSDLINKESKNPKEVENENSEEDLYKIGFYK